MRPLFSGHSKRILCPYGSDDNLEYGKQQMKRAPCFLYPLAWEKSCWKTLAELWFDGFKRYRYSLEKHKTEQGERWLFTCDEFQFECCIPSEFVLSCERSLQRQSDDIDAYDRMSQLVHEAAIDKNESLLQQNGSCSTGWRRSISLWTWLSRILFLIHGNCLPELSWDESRKSVVLRIGISREPGYLCMQIPAKMVWYFIKSLYEKSGQVTLLPQAGEGTRITFQEDNSLLVEPILLLQDGRVFVRTLSC